MVAEKSSLRLPSAGRNDEGSVQPIYMELVHWDCKLQQSHKITLDHNVATNVDTHKRASIRTHTNGQDQRATLGNISCFLVSARPQANEYY